MSCHILFRLHLEGLMLIHSIFIYFYCQCVLPQIYNQFFYLSRVLDKNCIFNSSFLLLFGQIFLFQLAQLLHSLRLITFLIRNYFCIYHCFCYFFLYSNNRQSSRRVGQLFCFILNRLFQVLMLYLADKFKVITKIWGLYPGDQLLLFLNNLIQLF